MPILMVNGWKFEVISVDSMTKKFDPRMTMLVWESKSVSGLLDYFMSDDGDKFTSEMWALGITIGSSKFLLSEMKGGI